jgi:molybdopterin/thiamine biosynthesis adenylyltransferase
MTVKFDYGVLKPSSGAKCSGCLIAGRSCIPRMRNATILVVKLKGVATEVIKNIVLAGIGTLIIADDEEVSEEDLGAGFFFRDEDVGRKVSCGQIHDS